MPVKTRYDEILEPYGSSGFHARVQDPTNVVAATKAPLYWQFYRDAQDEADTAREKMRVFASAYLAEMRKADIPYWFRREPLQTIRDGKDKKKARMLLVLVFGEDFVKAEKPELSEIVACGSYVMETAWGAYLRLKIRKAHYELYVPFPENVKPKDLDDIATVKFAAYYERDPGITEFCDETGERSCSYDWAEVVDTIREHVRSRGKEHRSKSVSGQNNVKP